MSEIYILSAVRTPVGIGKPGGALSQVTPINLTAGILQAAVASAGIEPARVDDVVWGCVTPLGEQGANLARLAVLKAGFPVQVPAVTLNRMCGSSQQAVHFAAQAILAGDMDIVVAGGTEVMSRLPIGGDWPEKWPDDFPYALVHQGLSAEMIAARWGLGREALDDYAYHSHLKAMHAIQQGFFAGQIVPVAAALKTVFKEDGTVTAGNSSQISDGSAALVLASPEAVGRYNLLPRARLVARTVVGSDPVLMLDGPIPATRQVLKKAGLALEDMDLIEINEAFASVVLAWAKEIQPDMGRVNPNGGAIALGHPLGASGAVLMTKLLCELERTGGVYGLQTMCIGHGMATATIIERI